MDHSLEKEKVIVLEGLLMEQMNSKCLIELRDLIRKLCNWEDLIKVFDLIL